MYFELPEEPPGLPDGSSAKGVYFIFEEKNLELSFLS